MTLKGCGMARKKGGDGERPEDTGDALYFTAAPGFEIGRAAAEFAKMMEMLGLPLVLALPSGLEVEFEAGCTKKEIMAGYARAMKVDMSRKGNAANREP